MLRVIVLKKGFTKIEKYKVDVILDLVFIESLCILCKLRWPFNGDDSSHALNRIFIL